MIYQIDGKKLKQIIKFERNLSLKNISKLSGRYAGYVADCTRRNRLSSDVITLLHDKYEINPARYVIGWKGDLME